MPNYGYLICPLFFLLGLPFIHADCIAQNTTCRRRREAEDQYFDQEGKCDLYRQGNGVPIPSYTVSRTCGKYGPIVLEDMAFVKTLAHYVREKIPQRAVHPKGAGASGYFEVTHDITEYTKAAVFAKVGLKTPMVCRFSPNGDTFDLARSRHGFACKLYTTEGNWDLVAQSLPVFVIRDPILYPAMIHSEGNNPVTGRPDPTMAWDFYTKRQESLSAVLYQFSDAGTPRGWRHMDGFGNNAFIFVNKHLHPTLFRFAWKTHQGIKNFTAEEVMKVSGKDPKWASKDLWDNIEAGNYPYWTLCVQLMSFGDVERVQHFNPLDATYLWPEHEFPCKPVGKMVLNKNPKDYFSEVEQAAYSPLTVPEGIDLSYDRLLQGRSFPYDDSHRHRLGINFDQLPVNKPRGVGCRPHSIDKDGFMVYDNQDGEPKYYPNSFSHYHTRLEADFGPYYVNGTIYRHDLGSHPNLDQAKDIYFRFSDRDKDHLAKNIAMDIEDAKPLIQCRVLKFLRQVSGTLAEHVERYGNIKSCHEHDEHHDWLAGKK